MARSKYVWLIIFEGGARQFVKAQTLSQIMDCSELSEDIDCILSVTKLELANNYSYENAIDIPFKD